MFIFSSRLKQSNLQIFGCVLLVILITGNIESVAVNRFRREVEKNQSFTDLNNVLKNLNKYCDSQKDSTTNDQVKSLTKEEISNSISEQSQISKERAENATTWLYEALQLYANDNWTEGNQNQICLYLKTRFDTAYGPYWICMTSRKNEPVYGVVTYDLKEGLIMFNLPNGLAFEVIKPKGGNDTLGNPTSLSKQEILESIWKVSTLKKERVENATLWMHDALKQYADENWVDGNQNQICTYMSTKFDETYGAYWLCSTSERNTNIYGVVKLDTKEGFLRFELKNGLNFLIFKAPSENYILGKPTSLSKQEILESIWKVSTLKKERVENATLWMHDALKQYADENWVDGNQNQICTYMSTKFDETYGTYWLCSTSERNTNIYGLANVDPKEGFIRFELKNGLRFLIFKAPCGNSKGQVKSLTKEEISNSMLQPSTVLAVIKEDVINWLYESLKLYADNNWVDGNQNKICTDVGKKLDEKYEQYWVCMASSSHDHNIYGYNTYEQKDGLIYFDLPNGLLFQIVKSASNCSRYATIYVIAYTMIAILLVTIIAMLVFFVGFISWQKLKIRKITRQNELLSLSQANTSSLLLIPIDRLKIGKQKLGSGEFSDVFAGKYLIDDRKVNVAIKNIKDVNEQELIKEAGIMARLSHIYLTKLYGICLADGCKMVTPLRELGSLKGYLQSQKNKIKPSDLLQYCFQVASGMEYLAERSIVHRDLAARNVLMKSKKHVEITDFGLSSLTQTDITIPSKMPFFWVAIECLSSPKKNLYCEATDVWSFGVTCWEILTFAKRPYENVFIDRRNVLQSMCAYLNNGNRLIRPENCSLELYQTLLLCWAPRSYSRPRFKILKETFEKYCETPSRFVLSKSIGNDKSIIDLKNIYNEDDEKISGLGLYNDNSMRDKSKKVGNRYYDDTELKEKQDAFVKVITEDHGPPEQNAYLDVIADADRPPEQNAYLDVIEDSDEPPNPIRRHSDPSYLTVISDEYVDAEKLRKSDSYIELINE